MGGFRSGFGFCHSLDIRHSSFVIFLRFPFLFAEIVELWRNADLNLFSLHADVKPIDLQPGVVAPCAVGDPEPPAVPGTEDDALVEVSFGERGPHVRTDVVDRVVQALVEKDCNDPLAHGERLAGPLGDRADDRSTSYATLE